MAMLGVTGYLAACNIATPNNSSNTSVSGLASESQQSSASVEESLTSSSVASSVAESLISSDETSSVVESLISSDETSSVEESSTSSEESSVEESSTSSEEISGFLVTFDTGGGTQVPSQRVEEGGKVAKPADPTKPSDKEHEYTFAGWFFENEEWNFETNTVRGNITLTAKWEVTQYTEPFLPSD